MARRGPRKPAPPPREDGLSPSVDLGTAAEHRPDLPAGTIKMKVLFLQEPAAAAKLAGRAPIRAMFNTDNKYGPASEEDRDKLATMFQTHGTRTTIAKRACEKLREAHASSVEAWTMVVGVWDINCSRDNCLRLITLALDVHHMITIVPPPQKDATRPAGVVEVKRFMGMRSLGASTKPARGSPAPAREGVVVSDAVEVDVLPAEAEEAVNAEAAAESAKRRNRAPSSSNPRKRTRVLSTHNPHSPASTPPSTTYNPSDDDDESTGSGIAASSIFATTTTTTTTTTTSTTSSTSLADFDTFSSLGLNEYDFDFESGFVE